MKKDIHPTTREVVFQDTVSGAQYRMLSTVKIEGHAKVTIDGTEYPLVKVDVSSASHPFFTGNQRIMDTAGRVEKFGTKYGKVASVRELFKKKPDAKPDAK